MLVRLDHIAIAVPDLHAAIQRFQDDLGLAFEGQEDVKAAQTRTAFFAVPGTHIELIHPLDGGGPVAGFLEKRGPGLHHLCFETNDIHGDMQRLAAKGYRFLSAAPTPGAHGSLVVFIHPKSADGVLIELTQRGPAADHGV